MTAAKRDLYIEQGATFQLSFTWHEGSAENVGPTVDLTGCIVRMQIRKKQQDPPICDASSEGANPEIVLGGTEGTITVTMSADDTGAMNIRTGVYDLEVEFPDGTVYRLLEGTATVSPNITQESDDPVVGA